MNLRSILQKSAARRSPSDAQDGPAGGASPDRARLAGTVFQRALQHIETSGSLDVADDDALRSLIRDLVGDVLRENSRSTPSGFLRQSLEEELFAELTGMGPLAPLMQDPGISDILINGPAEVWVDRAGCLERSPVRFHDANHLMRILDRMVSAHGRHLEEATPFVDVRLPDGSRLHAIIPPLCPEGPIVSIRRHRPQPFTMEQFVASGVLSAEASAYLQRAVTDRLNILVAGGASAGKTTLLNILGGFIPHGERLVTIEETLEMRIPHPHVIQLESRPANTEGRGEIDLRVLVRNALRMRADRIIVGEVRGSEVFDMLQAMNIGHPGSMTTVHANGVEDALRRMETLVTLAGLVLPGGHLRGLLGASFQVVVHMERRKDGTRQVARIASVRGARETWEVETLFARADDDGPLVRAGEAPPC